MLLRRVAARAGIGVWRHRGGVLLALAVTAALGGYMALSVPADGSVALGFPGGSSATVASDCADTAMAAVANKSPSAVQGAYQCMDPSFQQRVPEQVFVQQMRSQALPNVASVALHESLGFVRVACYPRIGWKLGRWHDVGWWQRSITDGTEGEPEPPLTLNQLPPSALERLFDQASAS